MQDNTAQIYSPMKGKIILIFLCIIVFLVTIVQNFPVDESVQTALKSNLAGNRSCPMTFTSLKINYFPPGINMKNFNLPGQCFKKPNTNMLLDNLNLNFTGFDWIALAPIVKFSTNYKKNNLKGFITLSKSDLNFKLDESTINLEEIIEFLPGKLPLKGKVDVSAVIELSNNQIFNFKINTYSKNLYVGPTNISIVQLPGVFIGNFQLRAQTPTSRKLVINDLIIGSPEKPLHGFFKGNIALNKKVIKKSKLDLKGQVKLSDELKEALILVEQLLAPYLKDDGYYHMSLGGTVGLPTPGKI